MKKTKFQAPTGTHDIFGEDQEYFKIIREAVEEIAAFYDFSKIDTPIIEQEELFSLGLGLSSEVVQKQMYTFKTKGDDLLTLRPEGTAPVVRAFLEHGMINLPQPVKFFYCGPFFRYENPQAGRFRQFWQFGFEVLGEEGAVIDAQIIQIFYNIFKELGLKNLSIELNSIGDSQCRPYYKKLLAHYFRSREHSLCVDCCRRLKENPLRILDCKEEGCQAIKSQAPQTVDHLCDLCRRHFKEVLEFLDEIELPYRLNPRLVRGLDYYTRTVFEIFEEGENMSALAGGGRYDPLAKLLGGAETAGVGGAAGVERVIQAMKEKKVEIIKAAEPRIFLAQLGGLAKCRSLKLVEEFRKAKVPIYELLGRDSLKTQLNRADKLGVEYTLILGQKEALENSIISRDMKSGRQETIKIDKILEEVKKKLKENYIKEK
ncbi:MAG: histidine--tRNA ligase [Candidatus Nealsonbacteria bacterium CG08_land_8_20_14_0_20_43_11]|uniref:Histidine--tRNA ligase n=1 Tax=Candidatus Nealsonbacteria bacterium CG08_land_8_20_14_0_20_43_11 TaxID=1974706 RepID=A0A2M6SZY0_9BACT|nr:MAG: histidine--tRNA ligase [Candidatus Nealsonbacteria bacterium CG08_land_8_20_14_0_20_43_11]